jgi:hypothetical protein
MSTKTRTKLTLQEQATNFDTQQHIKRVQMYLNIVIKELLDRGLNHDASKLESPEVEHFAKAPALSGLTYNTNKYQDSLKQLSPALTHHYAKNRHHPQHWRNGVEDMNLVDIVEMFADWMASADRQDDGNLRLTIDKNADKFSLTPQLSKIFNNTLELFE